MRRRVLIDGVEFPGSDQFLLGSEHRLVVGIQLPDGQIQGHYVEVVDSTALSYLSLRLVEEGVAQKAMVMLQQIGSASSLGILAGPAFPPVTLRSDQEITALLTVIIGFRRRVSILRPAYLRHPRRP